MSTTYFYNGFGKTPSNTHKSAGSDFYIPLIEKEEQYTIARKAFMKSYKVSDVLMDVLENEFRNKIENPDKYELINIIHLYLALQSWDLECVSMDVTDTDRILTFVREYLVFDSAGVPGIHIRKDDTLFVNSGIKVGLEEDSCGLYVNKSGMGNRGWDIRACLVDEDYSGYVHLSMSYTKKTHKPELVFCGDKITQMMVMTIKHTNWTEVDNNAYEEYMKNSARGADGFGSSDVKH